MDKFTVAMVSIMIVFITIMGLLVAAYNSETTVYGTVIAANTYQGSGELNGFANGQTSLLTYYNLTVSYGGAVYHRTVTCNLYHVGSKYPLTLDRVFGDIVPDNAALPIGC